MVVSGQRFNLLQMKKCFEEQIPNVRLISDMALSETDFRSLGVKLKASFSFTDRRDGIRDVMICYLIYWVYALIYREEEAGIQDDLTDFYSKLSQYQIRHYLQFLMDVFANYNIDDFGYTDGNEKELCTMLIARHAGIPDDEKYQVFDLIDDYRNQNVSVDTMVEDIYAHLPYKSHYIFSLLHTDSRQEIIWEIRTVMTEVGSGDYTREELMEKYPHMSTSLIDSCFYWQEEKALVGKAE